VNGTKEKECYMKERTFERMTTSLRVNFSIGNEIHSGTLTNLSKNGMFIITKNCLPLKSKFDILIPSDEGVMSVSVKVRRLWKVSNDDDGMGVELLNPSKQYIEFFNSMRTDNINNLKLVNIKINSFMCKKCSYIAFDQAPTICPFCEASIDNFDNNPDSLNILEEFGNVGGLGKKHFPVITLLKEFDSNRECRFTNAHVKIGEIAHNMDIDDHIKCLDFYLNELNLNKECVARVNLKSRRLNPEATIRLNNVTSGVLTVLIHCSSHGSWMTEAQF
jgi:desulfoferrodoxin (superoxide reductase-like protein)